MRLVICLLSFIVFAFPSFADEDTLSNTQRDEVRKLVRDTLLENPEILMEAMEILQKKQEMARLEQQKMAIRSLGKKAIEGPVTPVLGNPNGDVTVVEFFDYLCGYCKRAFPGVMEVVNSDKNVRFVTKEFAILAPESEIAARAALASGLQGKYLETHIALMSARGRLTEDKIYAIAAEQGIDIDQLKTDMKGDAVSQEIKATRNLAGALGINGTPAFIIGDQIIPGAVPPSDLKQAIKMARAQVNN